jgi:tape measure domain-containing protein
MMADYESRLSIEVKSDGVEKAKKSLADLTQAGARAEQSTEKLAGATKKTADEIVKASYASGNLIDKTEKVASASDRAANSIAAYGRNFAAGFFGVQAIRGMINVSDEFTKLTGQLKIATNTQAEFNAAFSDVQRIASRAQADLGTISTLYSRLSLSLREIGVSSVQVASITETVSLALKASGAGAGETASTMLQLSQAFGSGVLRGEEFNAVMEASPNLMRALAKSMGVPIGELRSLAAEGQITSDVLVKAFADPALVQTFRNQAAQVNTLSGAFTSLANELKLSFVDFEKSIGLFDRLAISTAQLGQGIKIIREYLKGNPLENLNAELTTKTNQLQSYDKADPLTQIIVGGPQHREQLITDIKKISAAMKEITNPKVAATSGASTNSAASLLKGQLDEFTKKNPLKDLQAATEKYNNAIKLLNDNLKAGNITKEEAARYEKQLKDELDRATTAQTKKNTAVKTGATEQQKAIDSLIESARRIAPINEDDIAQLQRKLDTTKNLTGVQKSLVQAEIEAAKARQEAANDDAYIIRMQDYAVSVQSVIDSLQESVLRQQDENKVRLGLADSVEDLVIARKEEKLEMLRSLGASDEVIAQLQREIDLRKQLSQESKAGRNIEENKKAEQERVRETVRANKEIVDDVKRASEQINRSLTDALLRGFESGKSFAENFKDTLFNMFRSLILQPTISFILKPITDAVAQTVAGAQNSSVTGAANDIFSNLKNVFTNTNSSIISGIESIGATIANGMGGIRDSIGGFIGKNAGAISNGISYAGALLQLSQGNFAGAAGTAIGTFFGGPVGGAIGSFIGSAVGSLFGGRPKTKKYSTGSNSTYADGRITSVNGVSGLAGYGRALGGGDALAELNETFSKALGSLFKSFGMSDEIKTSSSLYQRSSSKTRAWGYFTALFGDGAKVSTSSGGTAFASAQQALNALINNVLTKGIVQGINASTLPQSIKSLFDGLTDKTVVGNMIQSTINLGKANQSLIDSFDITASQAASVALQSGLAGDELAAVVNQLVESANASRSVGDMLVEFRESLTESMGGTLFDSLAEFDGALKNIDVSTQAGIEAFYELFKVRTDFANFTKTIDSLRGGVKGSLLGIVSDSEKQAILNADLNELFDNLGLSIPATIEELAALGKSIDYTTAEGINLANAFPALVNAFLATKNVIADLTKTADDFATEFEYLRYQALGKNYGAGFANSFVPSFAVGTNYVPADGLAMIHQGERIIPAADNQQLMQNSVDMVQAIRELRTDVTNLNIAMQTAAVNTGKTAKSLDNIERGGVIISDIGIDGNEQVLKVEVVA